MHSIVPARSIYRILTWPIVYQHDEPQNLVIQVTSTDDMTNAGKESANILNTYLNVSDETIRYKAEDLLEQAKQIQQQRRIHEQYV